MKTSVFSVVAIAAVACFSCSPKQQSPVDYVDPFIGTGFHGHTYPGATVPFGAVQLSPDTRTGNWDACAGYHYDDSSLIGFSHTHLSGTGCIDLGDILFRPTTIKPTIGAGNLMSPAMFSHHDEIASPGYYAVTLGDEGIKVELSATTHVGLHRYSFSKGGLATVIIDLAHSLDNEHIYEAQLHQTASNEISGMRCTRGWTDNQYVYFVAQFSKPFKSGLIKDNQLIADSLAVGNNLQAILSFENGDSEPIVAKVAISLVSVENARENMASEVNNFDFDAVHASAIAQWNDALSAITVTGGTPGDYRNFYTAMYHSMVVPNTVSDVNGQFRRHNMQIGQLPQGKVQYSTFSLWDTFRAWNPLMTLIDTGLVNNMINSFLEIYAASGELPIWPLSAGETGTMIGYHSASVIADAYLKGIRGFDANMALEAMIASSEKNKKGADYYIKHGFIPSNIKKESISCLLEYAYDDWCIASMAKELGRNDVYETYINRSQNYIHVFDGATKFFRGKRMDGNWENHFNPLEVGRDYTEATAWQYRFFVPHDVFGMTQLFGGKQEFVTALDSIFVADSEVHGDLADLTGMIGQYVHGNEPSHHIAYLYNYVGQPWKTQEMTRRLLHEMYQPTPQGISGNEDCGQMSAWYILTSLGIYPVCPGSNEFVFTTPLFEEAVLKLASGKRLTIRSNNPQENKYIRQVEFNGIIVESNFIRYEQLMEGGELRFTLAPVPDKSRGTMADAAPYSFTTEKVVSIPYVDKDLNMFLDHITVSLATATKDAAIRFTLDGSEPTEESPLYAKPFEITNTVLIKAKGFHQGFRASSTLSIMATKAQLKPALKMQPAMKGTAFQYFEGKFEKVSDIGKTSLVDSGIMPEPSIKEARQADHFGYIFSGVIVVPEDGVYAFQTRSDDGSMLYIDGELVVNNDGSHAAISATGMIALSKGCHSYKLLYFEDYEGEFFSWNWKLPSSKEFGPIPTSALFVK